MNDNLPNEMGLFRRVLWWVVGCIPYIEDPRFFKKITMGFMEACFKHEGNDVRFTVKNHHASEDNNEPFIVLDVLLSNCVILSATNNELHFESSDLTVNFDFLNYTPGIDKVKLEVSSSRYPELETSVCHGEIGYTSKKEIVEIIVGRG